MRMVINMIKLDDNDIILLTYEEAKNQIGIFQCGGKEIDNDTTIVYKMFDKNTKKTGSLATDHENITVWLCTADIFCKCGEYHHIVSEIPSKDQVYEILENIRNKYDISFKSSVEQSNGFLIVYDIEMKKVKKEIEDINDWL